jgi:cysteinyl-tRNA synthetase
MSRSVGNVASLAQLLERYGGRVVRALVLGTHYRAPMDLTPDVFTDAQGVVNRLDNFAREARDLPRASPDPGTIERFRWRMDDDLDTAGALAVVFGAVRDARADPRRAPALAAAVRECCEGALGLTLRFDHEELDDEVTALLGRRDAARARRDWPTADAIRKTLQEMGYVVEDGPGGSVTHRGPGPYGAG